MVEIQEKIDALAQTVEGKNNTQNILIFTLSTCQWCKKGKTWLRENNVQYRYIDVDLIDFQDKSEILEYLRDKYKERVSYPYIICDEQVIVGYDPNKYETMIKKGGD